MIETLIAFTIFLNLAGGHVVPDLDLSYRAQQRAEYFCTHTFSHEEYKFVSFFMGTRFTWNGEVLAKGFSSDQEIFNAWMHSLTHKEVLLSPKAKNIGVGKACGVTVELLGG